MKTYNTSKFDNKKIHVLKKLKESNPLDSSVDKSLHASYWKHSMYEFIYFWS